MNRKLTLKMDSLAIASFEAGETIELRGTVAARDENTGCPWSQPLSCPATSHSCASGDGTCRKQD